MKLGEKISKSGFLQLLFNKTWYDTQTTVHTCCQKLYRGMMQETSSAEFLKKQASITEVGADDQQKPAEDLIKEIATLEMQVVQLEQHLLSLYRKKFEQQVSPLYKKSSYTRFLSEESGRDIRERRREDKLKYSSHFYDPQVSSVLDKKKEFQSTSARFFSEHNRHRISSLVYEDLEMHSNSTRIFSEYYRGDIKETKGNKLELLNHSVLQNLENPAKKGTEKWGEQKILDSSINRTHSSLSQHFGIKYSTIQRIVAESHDETSGATATCQGEHFDDHETANWLSEEMIKCISTVYFTLADPPLNCHDLCSSPFSFSSAMDEFSPQKSGFSVTYCSMIEVKNICQDSEKLRDADHTLQRFRALVHRLDKVDPRKLKHQQKLAFWLNVHNALVMHAFLVYGIPQNNLKRMSLVLKASYKVGGETINAEMIQRSLLGCCLSRPGQWLQSFLNPKTKLKVNDPRQLFAIDHAEPLLHFAMCSGSQSDPAVRVYTPMRVYQELEAAKDDYIQLGLRVHKEYKILLPKTVELFAKECDLNPAEFVELVEPFLPTCLRNSIKQKHKQVTKLCKNIQWIPHNLAFGYLFSRELVASFP